jgi:PhoPQ-activated pathogenicity-related protein
MLCLIVAALGCSPTATAPAPPEAPTAPVETTPAAPVEAAPVAAPAAPVEAAPAADVDPASHARATENKTALDEYVYTPDPAFKYEKLTSNEGEGFTTTAYNLTSQTWLDESKVDRPLWEHTLLVTVPKEVKFNQAMMFIGGGGYVADKSEIKADNKELAQIAVMTKSIVCQIKQIPNQPLHFKGDTNPNYAEKGRKEDESIAFGWDKFLVTGDPIWLARLPMTKAVVRAMDVVQKENPAIESFFVAGASKRGWTTWTTAIVDKRVIGIAPCVIDVLNVEPSLQNHWDAYGFWAPAIGEYAEEKIVDRIHTPEFRNLMAIVDPYSYRDRLTMPKYIINSSGDQFFAPDSWKFYFFDLQGEKNLCYIPNTDHGLNAGAYFRLASFYHSVLDGTPRPNYSWEKLEDGSLRMKCETKPEKVALWQATNPDARDFRLESFGPKYTESPLTETEPGVYVANVAAPEKGWSAFFIQAQFPNPNFGTPFVFTTGISITPDTYPGKK